MMRYTPNDKYTIAWFKLAECVAKGEKEKAFGVYRLLKHSFDDQAYAHQLEGDLLDAFQDSRAVEKYAQAAHLYMQNGRLKEAATVYQELVFMAPGEILYIKRLIEIYNGVINKELIFKKVTLLVHKLSEKKMYSHIKHVVEYFECKIFHDQLGSFYQELIFSLLKNDDQNEAAKEPVFASIVSFFIETSESKRLQEFLIGLKETNEYWHCKAKALLR